LTRVVGLFLAEQVRVLVIDGGGAGGCFSRKLLEPVSYTHLDVYKRQIKDLQGLGRLVAIQIGEDKAAVRPFRWIILRPCGIFDVACTGILSIFDAVFKIIEAIVCIAAVV